VCGARRCQRSSLALGGVSAGGPLRGVRPRQQLLDGVHGADFIVGGQLMEVARVKEGRQQALLFEVAHVLLELLDHRLNINFKVLILASFEEVLISVSLEMRQEPAGDEPPLEKVQ